MVCSLENIPASKRHQGFMAGTSDVMGLVCSSKQSVEFPETDFEMRKYSEALRRSSEARVLAAENTQECVRVGTYHRQERTGRHTPSSRLACHVSRGIRLGAHLK